MQPFRQKLQTAVASIVCQFVSGDQGRRCHVDEAGESRQDVGSQVQAERTVRGADRGREEGYDHHDGGRTQHFQAGDAGNRWRQGLRLCQVGLDSFLLSLF